jgi:hypothetical protein
VGYRGGLFDQLPFRMKNRQPHVLPYFSEPQTCDFAQGVSSHVEPLLVDAAPPRAGPVWLAFRRRHAPRLELLFYDPCVNGAHGLWKQ